jgi:hypothetical protein
LKKGKIINIKTDRLKRFSFEEVKPLKDTISEKPELRTALKQDFHEALKAQNIVVDTAFINKVRADLDKQIMQDVKKKMDSLPDSKKKFYSRIAKGKPLKLNVKIDRKTGKHVKLLQEES